VFLDAGLASGPQSSREATAEVDFKEVWVCRPTRRSDGRYVYGVTQLELSGGTPDVPRTYQRHFRDLDGATPSVISQHNHETSIGAV